ncbi:hypothetical protein Pres01_46660 [Metapseudomonas resinovorans]|nr:hypothetical protein Pres01_46660 [Pseudomonas resinovorans]
MIVVIVVVVFGHGRGKWNSDQCEGGSGVAETHGDSLGVCVPLRLRLMKRVPDCAAEVATLESAAVYPVAGSP